MTHYSRFRVIDKSKAFILKHKTLYCHKCGSKIVGMMVIKRANKTRHYHKKCYEDMLN